MFGVWCQVSGGREGKKAEAWLQDVRSGIAVFGDLPRKLKQKPPA